MSEPFKLNKAVDLSGMVWFKAFKTLLIITAILGVLWALWVTYIKPHTNPTPTTTQRAGQIVNPTIEPKVYFGGCASIRVQENYAKEKAQNLLGNKTK